MAIRDTNIRSLAPEQEYEPEDDFGADEAFLRQVVAPTPAPAPVAALAPMPGDWMSALQQQNPNWILQAIQSQPASLETGEAAGPIEGYTFYDPSKTSTSDTFKRYDVSGNLLGEQKFKTPGDIADLAIEAGVDLAPILQYTPLGPAVKAIAAINAAREGDILPAIASAAGFGGYENVAKAAQAASALKNEDYLGAVLPALQAANIEDVGGYTPKDIAPALNVARAIQNENPLALLSAASAYLPGPTMPGAGTTEPIQENFFDPGGPGFMPTEALSQEEVDRELRSLLSRYPAPAAPSDWFPGENTPSGVPDWDIAASAAGLPIGNLEQDFSVAQTKTGPQIVDSAGNVGTFVNGEFVVDTGVTPNLGYAAAAPAPAPAPGKSPAPAAPNKPTGPNLEALFLAGMLATPQQQKQQEQQQLARTVPSPFGMDLLL